MELNTYGVGVHELKGMLRFERARRGSMVQAAVEERYASLGTDEGRRKIAETLDPFVFGLEPDHYSRHRGRVRSAGKLDVIIAELTLESDILGAADRFTFRLQFDPGRDGFEVTESNKVPQAFGADGCVPLKMRARFSNRVSEDEAVLTEARAHGRRIDEREIRWDWQPRWNFGMARLSGALAERRLASVFDGSSGEVGDPPAYVLLATWSFPLEKEEWGENGRFVRLVIDPRSERVVHRNRDDWHLLY